MKNKIIYAVTVCIIIAGAIVIATLGLKADVKYSKNVRIDVYLGKVFENKDIKDLAQDVFGNDRTLVQKVEYYGDMASITIKQENSENMDEKLEQFKNKINEKYELELETTDILVTNQPKIKLSSVLKPYILPLAISSIIILVYVIIRFRKLGILKTISIYVLYILASQAVFLGILAIARVPISRIIMPISLLIYVLVITIVTAIQEKKCYTLQEAEKKK